MITNRAGRGGWVKPALLAALIMGVGTGGLSGWAAADSVWLLREGAAVVLGNNQVRVRCEVSDGWVRQQFFARQDGAWALVAQSFRPPRPFPEPGNRLFQGDADACRWLVSEVLDSTAAAQAADGTPCIRLRGSARGAAIEQTIGLKPGARNFHLEVSARIPGTPPKLDYLLSTFTFELDRVPEFVHTPTLKYTEQRWPGPARDQVLGDRCFHAPAVILQEAGLFTALVPDLAAINAYRVISPDARRQMNVPRNQFSVPVEPDKYTLPTALDLNVVSGITAKPILSFGLMDYIIAHHMRYLRSNDGAMVRTLGQPEVRYAFDLFVSADAPAQRGYQDIARFQWERYGHQVFAERPHLAMPFAEYVRVTTEANLQPLGKVHPPAAGLRDTGSFLFFDLQGQPVGGYGSPVPFMLNHLSNSEFWNNVRDAVGMHEWGRRTGNAQFVDMAQRTINLALLAPQDARGMFPLNYRPASGQWGKSMFTAAPGKPSRLFSAVAAEGDTYDVVAMSRTATHLLRYYQRCVPDPRILAYVSRYAEGLLPLVDAEGVVPAYVSATNHTPYAPLAQRPGRDHPAVPRRAVAADQARASARRRAPDRRPPDPRGPAAPVVDRSRTILLLRRQTAGLRRRHRTGPAGAREPLDVLGRRRVRRALPRHAGQTLSRRRRALRGLPHVQPVLLGAAFHLHRLPVRRLYGRQRRHRDLPGRAPVRGRRAAGVVWAHAGPAGLARAGGRRRPLVGGAHQPSAAPGGEQHLPAHEPLPGRAGPGEH